METQLKVLTVTDASLADTVTCSINKINPASSDLYLRYAPGTAGIVTTMATKLTYPNFSFHELSASFKNEIRINLISPF